MGKSRKQKKSIRNRNRNGNGNKLRNKKVSRKKVRMHGGKLLGSGTFGSVYGEPRIPCEGEDIHDLRDNEVSKAFNNIRYADEEYDVIRRLGEKHIPRDELNRYFILPIQQCLPDKQKLKNPPYNNPIWWKKNADDQTSLEDIDTKIQEINSIIVYPKGGNEPCLLEQLLK